VYINPIVRQRRRAQVLLTSLVVLMAIIIFLPGPHHPEETATASAQPAPISTAQDIS
jgi:hypothetical protein